MRLDLSSSNTVSFWCFLGYVSNEKGETPKYQQKLFVDGEGNTEKRERGRERQRQRERQAREEALDRELITAPI